MKIKALFAAVLAAGLLFSGCRQDEDYVLPALQVGTESIEFGQLSSEQVVELTATREWMVRNKPEWVAVDPDRGPASSATQRVTVTVLDNSEYDRAGDVLFSIGLAKAAVSVKQAGAKGAKSKGTGTLEDPYTPEGAREAAAALGADVESATDVYIKGKISKIANNGTFTEGGTYGNASFYISEDGSAGDEDFYCYRILYLGNKKYTSGTDIAVGDEVIVCGKIVNFKGNTPETVAGKAFLYSLNGETQGGGGGNTGTPQGTGTLADPYNAAAANAAAAALAADAESDDIYIKGKICKIANNGTFSKEYGNASFYISDDGNSGDADFYCFRVLYLGNKKWVEGNTQIKVGDEVIIHGKITNYKGNTPETAANKAYIYSLNGVTEDNGQGGGGDQIVNTPETAYTVAKALEIINALADGATSSEKYYIKGKISSIKEKFGIEYGNATFNISDDGEESNALTAFRIKYFGGASYSDESATNIKKGDEVILIGPLQKYVKDGTMTPETGAGTYLYSLNGKTE